MGRYPRPASFAREDQFLSEALWHVRWRNRAVEASDVVVAWREQRILDTYFAPILRVAVNGRAEGHALSPEQRHVIEDGRAGAPGGESQANPVPIVAWRPLVFWTAVAGAVGALAVMAAFGAPRQS